MHAYWPGMTKDVEVFCNQCEVCTRAKDPPRHARVPLETIRAGFPFQILAMDFMGPFPIATRGSKYKLVAEDHFSKWF